MGRRTRARRDVAWNPPARGGDTTALFAVLVAVPLLLPVLSSFEYVLFALPLAAMAVALPRCLAVARRAGHPAFWRVYAVAAALGVATSALAVGSQFEPSLAKPAFYLGTGVSVCFIAGLLPVLRTRLRAASVERLADALLFDAVVVALGVWFVAVPGFQNHDPVLTAVFLVDLVALALAAVATLSMTTAGARRTGWWIVGVAAGAAVGDAFVVTGGSPALVALSWAGSAVALVVAAGDRRAIPEKPDDEERMRLVAAQTLLPLVAVLAFPAVAGIIGADKGLSDGGAVYFATFFVATLVLAFGRQAHLLLENRRAALSERRLRHEVVRRNEELEALTTLATTMTETLEEDPVVERGLDAIRIAARSSSIAFHVREGGRLELRAVAGEWATDSPWVTGEATEYWTPGVRLRGGRQLMRLAVVARGCDIGLVTLIRRADDPVSEHETRLLKLLVDQVAIAVQNARDYRERAEQAIRDPLTGLYNRRFFYEALEKEIHRSRRSGKPASLVLFDVDNFKQVNDTLGHAVGDQVLCEIGRLAEALIRPTDSFARVGGEEFALLLPEAAQLDALLVAERVRRAIANAKVLDDRTVTISAGVASCPDDATTVDSLESKADGALYWAKHNGKNLCAVATEVVVAAERTNREEMLAHLHALVSAIDSQHLNTRDHSENVAAYAVAIGQRMGLAPEQIVSLRRAALFHDIGKLAVRASVLNKPGELDAEETAEMRLHPVVGAAILAHSGFHAEAEWVRRHHEQVDGEGYPDGVAGERIPIEARIIFVADSFEAMTSDRPYRRGMPVADAVEEMRVHAGTQFDRRVVSALVELLEHDELPVLELRRADV